MIDPFTALGVASAAAQFIDFGVKLVAKTREVYKSTNGMLKEAAELKDTNAAFLDLSLRLSQASKDVSSKLHYADNTALLNAATRCERAAKALLHKLNDVASAGKPGKRESVKIALKGLNSESDLKRLQESLGRAQMELLTSLLVVVKTRQSETLVASDAMNQSRITMERSFADKFESIMQAVSSFKNDLQAFQGDLSKVTANIESLSTGQGLRMILEREQLGITKSRVILHSLCYQFMQSRQGLKSANPETYEWILDPDAQRGVDERPEIHFMDWLRANDGIFLDQWQA